MALNHKHIVQIVIKNTSTLDFTIPIYWKIKQLHPTTKISILYCVFDKKEILRDATFFSDFCKEHGIQEYDFSDFTNHFTKHFRPILKTMFSSSKADKLSFFEIKAKLTRFNLNVIHDLMKLVFTRIEKLILKQWIHHSQILPFLDPDILFFDNRSVTNFIGRDEIYAFMYSHRIPTYLIPHAPHMRDPISEFCPFDEYGEALPSFCTFMVPFKYGTPWVGREDQKEQFFISGYPGLDNDWLEYCSTKEKKIDKINVLFIIRRFLAEGTRRKADIDPFIIDYEEFIRPLNLIKQSMQKSDKNVHLIIKPHPANNYHELEKIMKKLDVNSWEISHEPIYPLLKKIDIVCSLASTVLLIPAQANIPTIIFDTKLQRQIHKTWDKLEKLYGSMQFYLNDNDRFLPIFLNILENLDKPYIEKSIRESFEDKSAELNINRILEG